MPAEIDLLRVQDDLRGLVTGDVLCDPLSRQIYASDASIFQVEPLGVVRPRSAADVAACVRYAAENGIPLHARGAGSGLAGESLGRGLVIDFSRSMRRVRVLSEDTVQVQPGVVLAELNRELARYGRLYGPDPATRSVTTMGSVLARDASGSHWPRYGSARDTIVRLQIVTAEGHILDLESPNGPADNDAGSSPHTERLRASVKRIHDRFGNLLPEQGENSLKMRGGYRLDLAVRDGSVDLPQLLCGSEGTLGLITEAVVRTEPRPAARGVMLLFFHRLDAAARGALAVRQFDVAACDLLDRRLIEIARETDARYERILPAGAEAMLLVELQDESITALRQRLDEVTGLLCDRQGLAFQSRVTTEQAERDFYWSLCRRVIPRLYRLTGETRAIPFVEDIAIPPTALPEFLIDLQNILKPHHLPASLFAHAGHGQLHIRPFLDLASDTDRGRLADLSRALFEKVLEYGGSISGGHAAGISRSWFLPHQLGELWPAMEAVKRAFDPANLLNPGKIVGGESAAAFSNFRPLKPAVELPVIDLDAPGEAPSADGDAAGELTAGFAWTAQQIATASRQCNGCARCRTTASDSRMCPMFRIAPREEASPRSKANVMRGLITGAIKPDDVPHESLTELTDLCFHCHQCRLDCPAGVDIPKLNAELKHQTVSKGGLSLSQWWPTRLDLIAPILVRLGPLGRMLLRGRRSRWVLERLTGLSRVRTIPPLQRRSFFRTANRLRLTKPDRTSGRKVAIFVDYFMNWHDHQLARALIEVLRHNRIGVYIPPRQTQSWMAKITAGDLETARSGAQRNVAALVDAVRRGYTIIATEPSAVLALTHEYPNLLQDADAQLVAENTVEACQYLWDLHRQNALNLDFQPLPATIGYHQPCHIRALQPPTGEMEFPGPQLMGLIPGVKVDRIERGCCGMAGTYGLLQKNYRNSLRIGWPLISAMRKASIRAASTECSACRMQIEQGSGRTTLHPIKLLAYAYGRLPDLESELPRWT